MSQDFITITEMDSMRLESLLDQKNGEALLLSDFQKLEEELGKARIIDFPEIPPDLVTMNTKLIYEDLTDDKTDEITIVYPHHACPDDKKISVTAPLGAALIGLREEEEIEWRFPKGNTKRLRVVEILYQPEANGDLHL